MKTNISGFTATVILTTALLLCAPSLLMAQKKPLIPQSPAIGVGVTVLGSNDMAYFVGLDGAASYTGDKFINAGFYYLHPLNKFLKIETGLEYARHHLYILPNLPPGIDDSPRPATLSLLNVPVIIRAEFLKYLFMNAGINLSIDASQEMDLQDQTGFGIIIGPGIKYEFVNGAGVFLNPYARIHNLVSFSMPTYKTHLMESGFRVGLTWTLKVSK
jgi:hypothetical protein